MSDSTTRLDPRVAVLEEIATSTKAATERLDRRMDSIEAELRAMRADARTDFRWLLGIMFGGFGTTIGLIAGLFAVMADGFHWY